MTNSPFGVIQPERLIAENELAIAFFDGFPISPGHSLIVPKRVFSSWWDASETEQSSLIQLANKAKNLLDAKFNPDGYNVGFNDGAVAGQTINHFHLHIIPRYQDDVDDPRGGIRWVIPSKANYWS